MSDFSWGRLAARPYTQSSSAGGGDSPSSGEDAEDDDPQTLEGRSTLFD